MADCGLLVLTRGHWPKRDWRYDPSIAGPGEGFKRLWRPFMRMDEAIKRKVDKLFQVR